MLSSDDVDDGFVDFLVYFVGNIEHVNIIT